RARPGARGQRGAPERRAGRRLPLDRSRVARGRPPAARPPRRVPRAPAAALGRLPDHGGGGRKAHGRHDPPPPHAAPARLPIDGPRPRSGQTYAGWRGQLTEALTKPDRSVRVVPCLPTVGGPEAPARAGRSRPSASSTG